MLENRAALQSLQHEWSGVLRIRERVRHLALATFALDTGGSPDYGDVLYNLPLLMAYDVLTQSLLIAREEKQFTSSQLHLGHLMDSAKSALTWLDWPGLRRGVRLLDQSTQSAKFFGDIECLKYMADIESQLIAWDIIAATSPRYT